MDLTILLYELNQLLSLINIVLLLIPLFDLLSTIKINITNLFEIV